MLLLLTSLSIYHLNAPQEKETAEGQDKWRAQIHLFDEILYFSDRVLTKKQNREELIGGGGEIIQFANISIKFELE